MLDNDFSFVSCFLFFLFFLLLFYCKQTNKTDLTTNKVCAFALVLVCSWWRELSGRSSRKRTWSTPHLRSCWRSVRAPTTSTAPSKSTVRFTLRRCQTTTTLTVTRSCWSTPRRTRSRTSTPPIFLELLLTVSLVPWISVSMRLPTSQG